MNREIGLASRHRDRFPRCRQTQCAFDEQRAAALEAEIPQVYLHREATAALNSSR